MTRPHGSTSAHRLRKVLVPTLGGNSPGTISHNQFGNVEHRVALTSPRWTYDGR